MLAERIGAVELRDLARTRERRELRLAPAQLSRLAAMVAPGVSDAAEPVAVQVEFRAGPDQRPEIVLRGGGALDLVCQRCLGPCPHEIELDVCLTVISSDSEAAALNDPFDSVVVGRSGLSLLTLIEDEILASLPLAPLHGLGAACQATEPGGEAATGEGEVHRPFADLASLLQGDADRCEK